MTRLRIVTVALVATWMTAFALGPAAAASPPPLFVYPGGHRFADGRPLTSPQTMDLEQITTNIPAIPELAGVVLMVT